MSDDQVCPTCDGECIVLDEQWERWHRGYPDDLPQFLPCPACNGTGRITTQKSEDR